MIALTEYPAIDLRFQPGSDGARIEALLYAALDDFQPLAIQEQESGDGWLVFFRDAVCRDLAAIALRQLDIPSLSLTSVEVPDEDWARRSQANLTAITVGRITIAPPWDVPTPGSRVPDPGSTIPNPVPGLILIVIDPSTGFGTGHHQTTRLCLEFLQGVDLAGRRVLDIGTGSGVLAIASAKLGAASVDAIDNDLDAIRNARENIERNDAAGVVRIHAGDLAGFVAAPADIVVANLTAAVLQYSSEALRRLVTQGGLLIVSGFSGLEMPEVIDALALRDVRRAIDEPWAAAVLQA